MTTHCMMFIKTLVKSSLDNYVLPGTMNGTEILWVYLIQWKRDIAIFTFASVYFLCSHFDFAKFQRELSSSSGNQIESE